VAHAKGGIMTNEPSRDTLLTSIIKKNSAGEPLTDVEKKLLERVLRGG
jgi:hypothetical protein